MRSVKAFVSGLPMCLLFGVLAFAQQTQPPDAAPNLDASKKTLTKVEPIDGDFEPVKIVCQKFPQDDDWLMSLEVEAENTSGKPIDFLELVAMICDVKNVEYCTAIPLVYGNVPAGRKITLDDLTSSKQPGRTAAKQQSAAPVQPIPPGGKIKLSVSQSGYLSAKTAIEKSVPIKTINSADLLVGRARHTDGSGWFNGSMLADGSLGQYKTDSTAFLVPKQAYIWGHVRQNRQSYQADIYAGRAYQIDEKGNKSRIPGYNRKIPRSKRIVVFSSGAS
jgi:hypothetical protein